VRSNRGALGTFISLHRHSVLAIWAPMRAAGVLWFVTLAPIRVNWGTLGAFISLHRHRCLSDWGPYERPLGCCWAPMGVSWGGLELLWALYGSIWLIFLFFSEILNITGDQ